MEETRESQTIIVVESPGEKTLEDSCMDGSAILKWILQIKVFWVAMLCSAILTQHYTASKPEDLDVKHHRRESLKTRRLDLIKKGCKLD
jgi:hypothetical protein